jgi:hypothetical protein
MYERFLLHVDVGPAGASLRFMLGLAFALAVRRVLPADRWVVAAIALGVVLFGVKAGAAAGRRAAGATPRVKAAWEWRRNLARFHDSYQVRKLLWIGAGILAAEWVFGPRAGWEAGIGWACLAAGAVAEAWWRRKGLALSPP